jgi:hypothetical protein
MVKNVIDTPVGIFTRKSATRYGFAAVIEAAVNPEQGLRVTGNRKGDPALSSTYEHNGKTYPGEQRIRYHIVWSRTSAGAWKNGENYVWAKTRVVGVFPVQVADGAPAADGRCTCGCGSAQQHQEYDAAE